VRRALPVILIVVVATSATAQGYPGAGGGMGGRSGMGGGRGGMGGGRGSFAPPNPSAEDVEKQDPVKLLLDKHKKLKLDKTQIAQLRSLGASLAQQNTPYYQRVDSLHKTFKVPSGGMTRSTGSDGDRSSMMENRQLFTETLTQLRQNNKAARDSAIVLLKEPQKKKAYDMLEKQLEESDKMLRSPGGEGGMGGGRRRPSPGN
jgi:hypothetical protein